MAGRKIIINSEKLETRVALLNGNSLEEYQIEHENKDNIVGSVFLGRIVNIQISLKAVFVDIGMEKSGFLHFEDMIPATYDETAIGAGNREERYIEIDEIPKLFPVGTMLFVQVTKGPIGTKGPRLTTNISIPGRYLVMLPFSNHIGVSKKIEDHKERERLKKIMLSLHIPKNMGFICRTVGAGRKYLYFKRELSMMLELWKSVEDKRKKNNRPSIVYKEASLIEKSLRDFLTEDISEVIIDDQDDFEYLKNFALRAVTKHMASRIKLYSNPTPIFERYGIEEKINKIFQRKVSLPSGGSICIDETEAFIAIDVNSGSSRHDANNNDMILNTNLEAADEIARQLRLRNIGGLVVIDFIDMSVHSNRDALLKRMRKQLENDRANTKVLPLSPFGLMQMTRQRDQQSLLDRIYDPCPYCSGTGKVKSTLSISIQIQRILKEILKRNVLGKDLSLRVVMNPAVLARLKNEDEQFLRELEDKYGSNLSFRADTSLHIEEFKIVDPATGEELS